MKFGAAWPERALRIFLVALAASTSYALWTATVHRAEFQAAFPGTAHPLVYGSLLATAVLGLVSLGGLWGWRRWGVVLYGLVAVASLSLDVVASAPVAHQATVVAAAVVMVVLVLLNRGRFAGGSKS